MRKRKHGRWRSRTGPTHGSWPGAAPPERVLLEAEYRLAQVEISLLASRRLLTETWRPGTRVSRLGALVRRLQAAQWDRHARSLARGLQLTCLFAIGCGIAGGSMLAWTALAPAPLVVAMVDHAATTTADAGSGADTAGPAPAVPAADAARPAVPTTVVAMAVRTADSADAARADATPRPLEAYPRLAFAPSFRPTATPVAGRFEPTAHIPEVVVYSPARAVAATATAAGIDDIVAPYAARFGAVSPKERECLAMAVYYEARGEPIAGQIAVAQVILNRVMSPGWPKTICGVIRQGEKRGQKCQFSYICMLRKLTRPSGEGWEMAMWVADEVVAGGAWLAEMLPATHYHRHELSPVWRVGLNAIEQIGDHVFYRTANDPANLPIMSPGERRAHARAQRKLALARASGMPQSASVQGRRLVAK